jgi:hypothetical protein
MLKKRKKVGFSENFKEICSAKHKNRIEYSIFNLWQIDIY